MRKLAASLALLAACFACPLLSIGQDQEPKHPRGLITQHDVEKIREKVLASPFDQMLINVEQEAERLEGLKDDIYALSDLTKLQAFLYLVTQDKNWADVAYQNFVTIAKDKEFVADPFSKGLTRAYALREMSYAYDFCFSAWSEDQRSFANNAIFDLMSSVNNNMGRMANYHIESNWMGVRYGSVVLAANILDETYLDQIVVPKKVNPFKWDTQYRLQDHIKAAYTEDGWFVETLGYHVYDWTFVAPALISLQNSSSSNSFDLANFVPNQLNTLNQHITSTLSIANSTAPGIKPDLGDDNLNMGLSHFVFGLRLMQEDIRPHLKWMVEYLKRPELYQDDFLVLALFPADLESEEPSDVYLNYVDETVGVAMFRNQFKDQNDVLACFNTSAKRFPGHSGPDNLTFRIFGLGGIWAIGAGRTGEVAGQTNLFPDGDLQLQKKKKVESAFLGHSFSSGIGQVSGKGSTLGVEGHERTFAPDYSGQHGATAVFVVEDESANGRKWRLNTPEFNQVEVLPNGFLITAPNGASLQGIVKDQSSVDISISRVRYGGSTVARNPGIGYQMKKYGEGKVIELSCEGDITVIMTLQPKGKEHPSLNVIDVSSLIE